MSRAPYMESGDARLCTGCAACAFACPVGAVSMVEDACGFVYPSVDDGKCVNCGKCRRSCHMADPGRLKAKGKPKAYGAFVKDRSSLKRSASGGIATAIAQDVVSRGGIAYSCVADRDHVQHERLTNLEEVDRARGSKYVQSYIFRSFQQLKRDLDAGREVLFIGTPCQCAAVRCLFSGKDTLLLVDLICEGVPSQGMYAAFLDSLEKGLGEKVLDFRFRDKRKGWGTKNPTVIGTDGKPLSRQRHSFEYSYYYLFQKGLILRDSCYSCPYACSSRVGDFTIGDFWGVESAKLRFSLRNLSEGISCVLVNTLKGNEKFNNIKDILDFRKTSFQRISKGNACLVHPSSCDKNQRYKVLASYAVDGMSGLNSTYRWLFSPIQRIKCFAVAAIPSKICSIIKIIRS